MALYTIPTGGGVPERVCSSCGRPTHWSKDGKWILFDSFTSEPASAGVLEVASSRAFPLLRYKASLYSLRFSPDDSRWLPLHLGAAPGSGHAPAGRPTARGISFPQRAAFAGERQLRNGTGGALDCRQ